MPYHVRAAVVFPKLARFARPRPFPLTAAIPSDYVVTNCVVRVFSIRGAFIIGSSTSLMQVAIAVRTESTYVAFKEVQQVNVLQCYLDPLLSPSRQDPKRYPQLSQFRE